MSEIYKLSCLIQGHSKDVRCLATHDQLEIVVSGSRDKSAKLWVPQSHSGYQMCNTLQGHNSFVSAVCIVHDDPKFPHGLIVTGGNDSKILGFIPDTPDPVFQLTGHSDAVCSIDAGSCGLFVSGSWDHTAKIWLDQNCIMTLSEHMMAVWCVKVIPGEGCVLTASADKTIKLWKAGACLRTFTGHSDCVRGLSLKSLTEFLSCSNDATIRLWNVNGEALKIFYGHENFIYCIARISDNTFVSSSEDRTIKIWKDGVCNQTITLPCQSVWCLAVTNNRDIIAGCSNATCYVFTCDELKMASPEVMTIYEEETKNFSCAHSNEIGDLKLTDLPGKESLQEPGKKDGDTKMIREGTQGVLYKWNEGSTEWEKIGDIVGASGGTQGKQLHEGKEYDFVFSVDVEDGKPPLKLPYNKGDDPWTAAQLFIHTHNLSQYYLDQVANFIVTNSGSGNSVSIPSNSSGNYGDPFTGGSRYIPGHSNDALKDTQLPLNSVYFPVESYLSLDTINMDLTINKVIEFNNQSLSPLSVDRLNIIKPSLEKTTLEAEKLVQILWDLLSWPADKLFPVLDLWRIAVTVPKVVDLLLPQQTDDLERLCETILGSEHIINKMLMLRLLCNLFSCDKGRTFVMRLTEMIFQSLVKSLPSSNKNFEIAATSILVNFGYLIYVDQTETLLELQDALVARLAVLLPLLKNNEAQYRSLVALGTVCSKNNQTVQLCKSLNFLELINPIKFDGEPAKLKECASDLSKLFQ